MYVLWKIKIDCLLYMKLFLVCLKVVDHKDDSNCAEGTESPAVTQYFDIDDALQDNLCKLWDMSMNTVSTVYITYC